MSGCCFINDYSSATLIIPADGHKATNITSSKNTSDHPLTHPELRTGIACNHKHLEIFFGQPAVPGICRAWAAEKENCADNKSCFRGSNNTIMLTGAFKGRQIT